MTKNISWKIWFPLKCGILSWIWALYSREKPPEHHLHIWQNLSRVSRERKKKNPSDFFLLNLEQTKLCYFCWKEVITFTFSLAFPSVFWSISLATLLSSLITKVVSSFQNHDCIFWENYNTIIHWGTTWFSPRNK